MTELPRAKRSQPLPPSSPALEWQRLVVSRGVAGTADVLMEQDRDITFLLEQISKLERLIAESQDASAMKALREENEQLKCQLSGGGSVVTCIGYNIQEQEES